MTVVRPYCKCTSKRCDHSLNGCTRFAGDDGLCDECRKSRLEDEIEKATKS